MSGMLFVHSAPNTMPAQNIVSENEIRKGLKLFVRSNLFVSFIYLVMYNRTLMDLCPSAENNACAGYLCQYNLHSNGRYVG